MQFLLYCLCGGLGVATDYTVYWLAIGAGAWYQTANVLGYLAGTLLSFALNRAITFRMHDRVLQRLTLFLGVAAVGFASSALLLWGLVDGLQMDARLAKLLTLSIVVMVQFSLNRHYSFRATPAP